MQRHEADALTNEVRDLKSQLAVAQAEVRKLQRWNDEMKAVEAKWDPQKIANLLNIRWGDSIREKIEPKIKELIEAKEKAERERYEQIDLYAKLLVDTDAVRSARDILAEENARLREDISASYRISALTQLSNQTQVPEQQATIAEKAYLVKLYENGWVREDMNDCLVGPPTLRNLIDDLIKKGVKP